MLRDLHLGKRKVKAGLILREAMLINGVLFNSEAWPGLTSTHIARLQVVDNALLREITSSHANIATEFLYLETGTLQISYIITSRRLNYLKHILNRNENDLIRRIKNEQQEDPIKGDWINLVKMDLENTDPNLDEKEIMSKTKKQFKTHMKPFIYQAVLN